MTTNKPFAEVIESSLQGFLAQSWEWDNFPSFASLVTVKQKNRIIFGIVHQVKTGSMDPMRYPFPYQKTEEELIKEQPQIFEFLKTTFACIIIGYRDKGNMNYILAPEPPKIHSFVEQCDADLSASFFANNHYLHSLFSHANSVFNMDELLLALLNQQKSRMAEESMNHFMQKYALLIGNDYQRIKLFLQRAQHIIEKE